MARQSLLSKDIPLAKGKEGAAQAIEHLGYVQIDTIAVIERAHHHCLWTRVAGYRPGMLEKLLASDRRVFEYWGHAASYLPMSDYRFYLHRMRSFPWGDGWIKRMYENHKPVMEEVLARVRKEGPLASTDFEAPKDRNRGTWWDWKPAKAALELLMWRGDLMVAARRNFQRVYDISERVLPDSVNTKLPSQEELSRFRIERALSSLGVATIKDIQDYLHLGPANNLNSMLSEMLDSGEVAGIKLEGEEGSAHFAFPQVLDAAAKSSKTRARVYLLSPFDNLVINRRRLKRLFGFNYAMECYLPKAKRKYGYFTLPILFDGEFIGRIDPKADRATGTLIVNSLTFESHPQVKKDFLSALAQKIRAFARFNSCSRVRLGGVVPSAIKRKLEELLKD